MEDEIISKLQIVERRLHEINCILPGISSKDQISYVIKKFQEYVKISDEIISKFKKLENETLVYFEKFECKSNEKYNDVKNSTAEISSKLTENLLKIDGINKYNLNEIEKLKISISNLFDMYSPLSNQLSNDSKRIDNLMSFAKRFEELENKFISSKEKNLEDINFLKAQNEMLVKELKEIKSVCKLLNEKLNENDFLIKEESAKYGNFHVKYEKIIEDLKYQINANFQIMNNSFIDNKNYVDFKFKEIKIPDVSRFITNDIVLKLQLDVEHFTLDVKNSLLKSSNNDMQIQLLSKKIENLLLLQKQSELKG